MSLGVFFYAPVYYQFVTPYYSDDLVTFFLGDCREILDWTACDGLLVDPPYGRGWKQGKVWGDRYHADDTHEGIAGDDNTELRDWALTQMNGKLTACFGDLMLPPPVGTKQVLVYLKPADVGGRGATAGYRRDLEAIYLIGPWPSGLGGQTSLLGTGSRNGAGAHGLAGRYKHPHAKPVDVMEKLVGCFPVGTVIADPFAGSGSSLVAARNRGYRAVGVEVDERYAERVASRLSQQTLFNI